MTFITKKTYGEKLLDPRWQKKRLEILQRDNFTCNHCGDEKSTLHVHHIEYENCEPWEVPEYFLITLCDDCHKIQHLSLTQLEKFLLSIIYNRDEGKTSLIKLLNKAVTGIKQGDPYYKDYK